MDLQFWHETQCNRIKIMKEIAKSYKEGKQVIDYATTSELTWLIRLGCMFLIFVHKSGRSRN